jgi:hypothetical protein
MLTKRCCNAFASSAEATGTPDVRSPADAALPHPAARAAVTAALARSVIDLLRVMSLLRLEDRRSQHSAVIESRTA